MEVRLWPEIFRSDGCVVKVFSDDHTPAHVHVTSAEHEIKAAWESIHGK